MTTAGQDIVVFWASQSGTSEQLAVRLGRDINARFGKSVLVADLSDYNAPSISQIPRDKIALFILSTYGEGNPSDNGAQFCSWLGSDAIKDSLDGFQYSMLGLGNSNYKYYNQFARLASSTFQEHHAVPILELYLADDAAGQTKEHFWAWEDLLFKTFAEKLGYAEKPHVYKPSINIDFKSEGSSSTDKGDIYNPLHGKQGQNSKAKAALSAIRKVNMKTAYVLATGSERTCLHVDLDISNHIDLTYEVGDHLGVWPQNPVEEVAALQTILDIPAEDMHKAMVITSIGGEDTRLLNILRSEITLDALFTTHLEICSPVSRQLARELESFAPSETARQWLRSITMNNETFTRLQSHRRITLASVLRIASSGAPWNIPLAFVIENLPALRPRYYSIASAPSMTPRQISLTVGVLKEPLEVPGESIRGLASNYILDTHINCTERGRNSQVNLGGPEQSVVNLQTAQIFCHIRKFKFKPPVSAAQSMIMVATGTGIAPFRGFLQHRVRLAKVGRDVGKMVLFFGCRGPSDHLYREELIEAETALGKSLDVIIAYSRVADGKSGHVQDRIRDRRAQVAELIIENRARVYICGSTKMAKDVRILLCQILCESQGWSEERVGEFEKMQVASKQWQEDVWG